MLQSLPVLLGVWASVSGSAAAFRAPEPRVTQRAILPSRPDLAKRQDDGLTTIFVAPDNTCGYYGGNVDNAATCFNTLASCVFVSQSGTANRACCDNFGPSCADTFPTTFMNLAEAQSSGLCTNSDSTCNEADLSSVGERVGICDGTQPFANIVTYPEADVTDWICGFSSKAPDTLFTTHLRQGAVTWVSTVLGTPTPTDTSGADSPGGDGKDGDGGDSQEQDGGGDGDSGKGGAGDGGSSTPVGPIVGGVVGGIAVLALLGLAVFFILRKKKNSQDRMQPHPQQDQQHHSMQPPMGQGYGYGQQPPQQQHPHTSMMLSPEQQWHQQQQQPLMGYAHPGNQPGQHMSFQSWQNAPTSPGQVPDSKGSPQPMMAPVSPGDVGGHVAGNMSPHQQQQQWTPPPAVQQPSPYVVEADGTSYSNGPSQHHHGVMQELPAQVHH